MKRKNFEPHWLRRARLLFEHVIAHRHADVFFMLLKNVLLLIYFFRDKSSFRNTDMFLHWRPLEIGMILIGSLNQPDIYFEVGRFYFCGNNMCPLDQPELTFRCQKSFCMHNKWIKIQIKICWTTRCMLLYWNEYLLCHWKLFFLMRNVCNFKKI